MAARRRRQQRSRNDYVGCSLRSDRGRLRLEWRTQGGRRASWPTGERDTPEARKKWEEVRGLVGKLRATGEDPRPYLAEHYRHVTRATPAAADAPTIRLFYRDWMATKREGVESEGDTVRPALLRDYVRHFTRYILPDPLVDQPLATLRPLDMKLFQSRLYDRTSARTGRPLSPKTVSGVMNGSLRALLRDAQMADLVTRDLYVGLTWRKWDIPPADPLAPDEWDAVAAWFSGREFQRKLRWRLHPAFHGFVVLQRWHGCRPSEAAALTWDDVDLHQGIAYVRGSYHHKRVCKPKTRAARRSIELHPDMLTLLRDLRPLRPDPGQPVFPNMDGQHIRNATFWNIWTRCLQDCRIRHRGLYCLKDTFVTHVLAMAEATGEVERLTAWLVRQTGVRIDTLKQHYERWWPRDRAAIRATYALLDPTLGANCRGIGAQATKKLSYTANRKWTMSPSCTT
jgi:integrase